jgi:hypothetical protein
VTDPTTRSAAERLIVSLRHLNRQVVSRGVWGLPQLLIQLIVARVRGITFQFERLAALVASGRYVPRRRRTTPRRSPILRGPRKPDPLPKTHGWMKTFGPELAMFGPYYDSLFRDDPEMIALIAAAPDAMRRPLRSLCRMFGIAPPILARPKPLPPAPEPAPVAAAKPAKIRRPPVPRPAGPASSPVAPPKTSADAAKSSA